MYKIYWLDTDVSWNNQLRYASAMRLLTEVCPFNPDHPTKQRWPRPLRVIGPLKSLTDFEVTVYSDFVLDGTIVRAIQAAGCTGVEFPEVQIVDSTETPVSRDAFELRVQGWGGIAPPESGIRVIEECPSCRRKVYSGYTQRQKLFCVENWDRSDFFIVWPLPRYPMVTEKVRKLIRVEGWSGIQVRPLEELPGAILPGVAQTLSPGHLEDWFGEESLRKIEAADRR